MIFHNSLNTLDLKKKPLVREVNPDAVFRMKEEELKNHEKIHKNLYSEQDKLQRRLDIVSDPKYPAELKRRHQELEQRLKTLNKEQKTLVADQARREKRLDKLINVGESEAQRDC